MHRLAWYSVTGAALVLLAFAWPLLSSEAKQEARELRREFFRGAGV